MTDDALHRDLTPAADHAAQASNLAALVIEVSLTAGRGTVTVCGHDDSGPELVAVRPLATAPDTALSEGEREGHADAVIFGWLVSP